MEGFSAYLLGIILGTIIGLLVAISFAPLNQLKQWIGYIIAGIVIALISWFLFIKNT